MSSSLYTLLQEKTVNMRHLTDENLSLKEETSILRVEVDKLQKDISTLRLVKKNTNKSSFSNTYTYISDPY